MSELTTETIAARAWCGGLISGRGQFTTYVDRKSQTRRVRMVLDSSRDDIQAAIKHFAMLNAYGVTEARNSGTAKPTLRVQVSGASLDILMRQIWEFIPPLRRTRYRELLKECTDYNEKQLM